MAGASGPERAGGQPTTAEPRPAGDTNFHSLAVKVLDAVTANAIPNATVTIPFLTPRPGLLATNDWRFVTDERGVVTVQIPAAASTLNYFVLAVSNANHPARMASWGVQSGPVRRVLPSEYTFKLGRGVAIGGFVRDEQGNALAGVTVAPWGQGSAAFSPGRAEGQARDYSSLDRNDAQGVRTDAKGFWIYTNFPTDIASVKLDVVWAGGSRSVFASPERNQWASPYEAEEISYDELRATNAVLVLKAGVTVRGIVVDEAGKPVAGVRFRERGGGYYYNVPMHRFTNRSDGRFELPHRTAPQFVLTAEAGGFATASTIVTLTEPMPEVRIALPSAQPLRLRLLGDNDEPLVGASLTVLEGRNRGHLLEWNEKTDAEGRAVWTNAPRQELSIAIRTTKYPPQGARLKADGTEKVVRLRQGLDQAIVLHIRARAADSDQPIAAFKVWRDLGQGPGFKSADWTGTSGEFRAEFPAKDFGEGWGRVFRLQVRAEGYAPWTSDQIYFDEGDFETSVKLKKAAPPGGVVLQPDGQPANEAKVMLNTGQGSIFANAPDSYYPGEGVLTQKTGADGAFRFDTAEDEQRVLITHRSGFASVRIEELRRTGKAPLQAWARMDGVLRVGGKPRARERISIKSPLNWINLDSHHLVFSANTDAGGRFVFTNLPPGDYVIYRTPHLIMGMSTTESHRMIVQLKAGETKEVDYSFGGRLVVGQVDAGSEVDWSNDPHLLALKLPAAPRQPNYWAFADPKEFEKARKAYGKSPEVLDYERKQQQFQLVIDREGNFKVDDVPPGKYELRLRATKPNTGPNRYQRTEEVLGSLTREVTIPAGAPGEEFDLGTLEMETKGVPGPRTPPIDFFAETLDGKPFNLVSLRGKPVIALFWANWAPQSAARLADLRAVFEKLDAAARPHLVTVNLDEEAEAARAPLKHFHGWTHTRLHGSARFDVAEQLEVDTLPKTLLLDSEGRVAGRDLNGKRLRSAVERLRSAKK